MALRPRLVLLFLAACCGTAAAAFGHSLLPLFSIAPSYRNLNHGSYGSCPKSVTENQTAWLRQCEENPDKWFRSGLGFDNVFDFQDSVRAQMAAYIGAEFNDTVFIDNASNGVNAVMRSLARALPPGKKILLLNTAYYMVKMVLQYLEPAQTLVVNISMPGSDAQTLAAVAAALAANDVYAASFSHIVSVPAVILPVKELAALCHAHGALVLIDGAHALGQIPVDVAAIGADFWLGNGHKWCAAAARASRERGAPFTPAAAPLPSLSPARRFYSPKGSAVLWVRRELQPLIEPTVISWEGRGATHFQLAFSYVGTTDMTRALAMGAALAFRASVGTEAQIFGYMHSLAVEGGRALARAWGTELLFEDTSRFAAMVDVRVPTTNATLHALLGPALMRRYDTFVPIYDLSGVGGAAPNTFYARVSCQIYTELADIMFLAQAVLDIIKAGG